MNEVATSPQGPVEHSKPPRSGRFWLLAAAVLAGLLAWGGPTVKPVVSAGPSASRYVPVSPTRLFDTRSSAVIAANTSRDFKITGGVVPDGATAVVLNMTATRSGGSGYLQAFPSGQAAVDSTSTLNVDFAGQTIANAAFAPLGDRGQVTVFTTFTTDVILDVFGYFVPAESATAGRIVPLTPTRILDTRNDIGYNTMRYGVSGDAFGPDGVLRSTPTAFSWNRVIGGQTVTFQVGGRGGVPVSGVSAVIMNVTVDAPTAPGFVQVGPTPIIKGTHSNLNPEPGRTIANLVVVPLGDDGQVDVYSELYAPGSLDLIADVVGYFTDSTAPSSTAGMFVPITPIRNVDTRQPPTQPEIESGVIVNIDASKIPAGASAIAGNLTSTGGGRGGYLQLAPTPVSRGASSSLNTSYEGQTIANAVVTPVAAGGNAQVYTYGSTHIVLDITGWFTGAG